MPAVAGGLVAVSAAVAAAVATLGGVHHGAGGEPAVLASAGSAASTAASTVIARAAARPGGTADGSAEARIARAARAGATPASVTPASEASTHALPSGGPPEGSGSPESSRSPGSTGPHGPSIAGEPATRLIVPDAIASVPGGLTRADLDRIKRLSGVRAVLAIDGAQITVNGARLTVLAAPEAALRPWTPPATAASDRVWSAFRAGHLITTGQAASAAHLARGRTYPVAAAVRARIVDGGTALLGVAGVDGVVNQAEGRRLGLVKNVAVLVNAPAADMTALVGQVRAALGQGARVVRLVPVAAPASLPVDKTPSTGRPTNYLELFKESAARYCPGLSWTVLAAIGQIESADGQNMGPSTAGALGPMQFLPSTWATWGINGFGDTGQPNIMNPFDAVPSAARLLCANGATTGAAGLRQAIFGYNHATWYVDEVLALAAEYAREY
ncbi:MAG TPA: lytic transglycosylase domain-containing protein [Trebonia sp.]